jgi:hypothetical protein
MYLKAGRSSAYRKSLSPAAGPACLFRRQKSRVGRDKCMDHGII